LQGRGGTHRLNLYTSLSHSAPKRATVSDLFGWALFGAADGPAQPEFAHSAVAAFGLGHGRGRWGEQRWAFLEASCWGYWSCG